MKAKITWLSEKQGGRKSIPNSDKYAPVVKITRPKELIQNETWSLILTNLEHLTEFESIAEIQYLSDKAPDNLKKEVEFELFEGNKLVAKGIVI